jgi:hypothetical protein
VISRRDFLLSSVLAALFSNHVSAHSHSLSNKDNREINWLEFQAMIISLAKDSHRFDDKTLSDMGINFLKRLDVNSQTFKDAVAASYESGNRYWLWQRMIKLRDINGGILNIDNDQMVQLHDHPGATGLLRILSGEAEVWQFDEVKKNKFIKDHESVELTLVSHHILRTGDTAVLTPNEGNIHALRSLSKECRMLDFFIPPYERGLRSWYEPVKENWFNDDKVNCRKISERSFSTT